MISEVKVREVRRGVVPSALSISRLPLVCYLVSWSGEFCRYCFVVRMLTGRCGMALSAAAGQVGLKRFE
jgi:hypothetical protein